MSRAAVTTDGRFTFDGVEIDPVEVFPSLADDWVYTNFLSTPALRNEYAVQWAGTYRGLGEAVAYDYTRMGLPALGRVAKNMLEERLARTRDRSLAEWFRRHW